MKLRTSVHNVERLCPNDRNAMFRLIEQSFANKQRDSFFSDLDAKHWVILVRRPDDDRLVGFSTQVLLQTRVGDKLVTALYSGDTVVGRNDWGDPALAHAWGNFALELIDQHPFGEDNLYWFLTSKGFRTYHYLPLFFRHYFPRPNVSTPRLEQSIIDAFGRLVGKDRYFPAVGIIRADDQSDFVRPELAELGTRPRRNEHVHFFVERNPGYGAGDELCCLAPLSRENFTPAAYRVIGSRRTTTTAI